MGGPTPRLEHTPLVALLHQAGQSSTDTWGLGLAAHGPDRQQPPIPADPPPPAGSVRVFPPYRNILNKLDQRAGTRDPQSCTQQSWLKQPKEPRHWSFWLASHRKMAGGRLFIPSPWSPRAVLRGVCRVGEEEVECWRGQTGEGKFFSSEGERGQFY